MQKSKLGISVGLLGAIICIAGLAGGYVPLILLAFYILWKEDNAWLRKLAVKAVVIVVSFSALSYLVGLVPEALGAVNSLFGIININISFSLISGIARLCVDLLDILKTVILLLLALKALTQGDLSVGPIDNAVNKHFVAVDSESTTEKNTAALNK